MLKANLQNVECVGLTVLRWSAHANTLIITFFLIIHLSQYIAGIQPLHFEGGFNAWMGIDSFLGSHAGFIPPTQTGRGKI